MDTQEDISAENTLLPVPVEIIREASHAGSWYKDDPEQLHQELDKYMQNADKTIPEGKTLRGVVGPHAGIMYSGA